MTSGPHRGTVEAQASPIASDREAAVLRAGRYTLSLARPLIMGVLNVTPDSFSDGGRYGATDRAIAHARTLIEEGADILDIGGESTRPGALPVTPEQERNRVLPVLQALAGGPVPISVDTRTPDLMRAALTAGASMINDISALEAAGAIDVLVRSDAAVCLMHKQGDPQTMQDNPAYGEVVTEVAAYLQSRIDACTTAGISRDRIVVDPGFGFGKTLEHNLQLLRRLGDIAALGMPVLVGLSRKGMLGRITGRGVDERLHASVAAALIAVQNGARIVRVHDVAATRDALRVWCAATSR